MHSGYYIGARAASDQENAVAAFYDRDGKRDLAAAALLKKFWK